MLWAPYRAHSGVTRRVACAQEVHPTSGDPGISISRHPRVSLPRHQRWRACYLHSPCRPCAHPVHHDGSGSFPVFTALIKMSARIDMCRAAVSTSNHREPSVAVAIGISLFDEKAGNAPAPRSSACKRVVVRRVLQHRSQDFPPGRPVAPATTQRP
jgi:hypothetical protein